jgi:hypothetical protein
MRRTLQILLLTILMLASVAALAAGLSRKQRNLLEEAQNAYGATIRWGSAEDAIGYLDPDYRKAHPLTELELRRYSQIRVSSYRERSTGAMPDGSVERRVEIGVINVNTQAERLVLVREVWRWDAEGKRWWQASGLPDLWPES